MYAVSFSAYLSMTRDYLVFPWPVAFVLNYFAHSFLIFPIYQVRLNLFHGLLLPVGFIFSVRRFYVINALHVGFNGNWKQILLFFSLADRKITDS